MLKSRLLAALLAGSVISAGVVSCDRNSGTDRWTVTEDTNVDIDWDKVNEAYKAAEGPEDLEKRINEIYEGKEIISIAVKDENDKSQVVTGFFDKNTSGTVDEGEKIFTIKRTITADGSGQVHTQGHGHYGSHIGMFDIAAGMLLGSMMMNAFSPRYAPMYGAGYTTSAARAGNISSTRQSYRQANPSRFSKPSKSTGRSYGGGGGRSTGGSRGGGGRFGLTRKGRTVRPQRLTA